MKWITEYIGRPWIDIILTALSAAFLILTFPKSEMYYLAYVALVPLILIIKKSDPLKAFIYSLSAGLIFYTQFLWWLLSTEGVNPFNFTLGVFLKACYLGLFGL